MLLVFALLTLLRTGEGIGRVQSVGVFGKLMCNGVPEKNVLIKLYDNDRTDLDDLLQTGYTDENGEYYLQGWTEEISAIDPKINYYHDCNDKLPCQIKFSIKIPDNYITNSKMPAKYFDAGVLPLDAEYPGQTRDCLHFSMPIKFDVSRNISVNATL